MRSHSPVPAAAIQALAYARINLLQRQDTRLRTSLPSHPDAREANPTVGSSSIFRCQRAQVRGPTTPLLGIGRIGMQPTRECMQPLPWALIIKQDHLRQSPIMALAGNPQDGTFYAGTRHSLEKSKFRPSNTLAYLSPHECGVCKGLTASLRWDSFEELYWQGRGHALATADPTEAVDGGSGVRRYAW
jgi:hypothetical protein